MLNEELERALAPVREHHKAQQVTPNTILAAYIRSMGENPVGMVWETARSLLDHGLGFKDAAERAIADYKAQRAETDAIHTIPSLTDGIPQPSLVVSSEDLDARNHENVGNRELENSPESRVHNSAGRLRRRSVTSSDAPMEGYMEWFPKVFGPGDIDGTGAARLLGTPNVPLSTVLIRETAQNSWDARLGHVPVTFGVHLRELHDAERCALRDHVFLGAATGLGLREALERPHLRVLEISDRGTKGLGGPTQNDVEPPLGSATNYIDLILNVGAPRDVHLGGGTYGFGKTISYRVSRSGTVLMWSRSVEGGSVQDRLIGSAIGTSFTRNHRRYTGRHWWGSLRGEHHVEPWTDHDAATLARGVFDADFDAGETGTSIMIIDPDLGGDTPEDDIQRISDAIVWNLWPKLLPTSSGEQPMHIELYHNGIEIPLPAIDEHPVLAGHAESLQLVRATQNGETFSPRFNTQVLEVWCQRPKTLVGHLGITRFPKPGFTYSDGDRDTVPVRVPSNHIAWMRHDAELVVRYDEKLRLDSEVLQWAGVFKPVEEHDDAFASAEPPAHDDWVATSIENKADRRIVNVGLRRIGELVTAEFAPTTTPSGADGPAKSVAVLADSLARLIASTPGSKPQRRPAQSTNSGTKARTARAQVVRWEREPVVDGYRVIGLLVEVTGATKEVVVTPDVGVATDGTKLREPELADVLGWRTDGPEGREGDATFSDGQRQWLMVRAAAGAGIDVSFAIQEVEA